MGITDFINPRDDEKPVYERIREMTCGGVHYSFECTGNLNVLRDAFLSAHEGWGLTVILGIHPSPQLLPIHPMELFQGRRIVGSVFGGFKGKTQLPHFAKECMDGIAGPIVIANENLNPNDTRRKTVNYLQKAAVAYGPGKPFVVERVLVHPPQKMEVRIKILFTSISHTDLSSWQGEDCGECG
ncbi:hypothetical protein JHK85_001448 [Glycine max]|nr:hypothetical protein JHK85_001448 [Glycine max]